MPAPTYLSPGSRRRLLLKRSALFLLWLLAAVGFIVWIAMRASLPEQDGHRYVRGLQAGVLITRDDRGTPTVQGSSREDVAYATGLLHGQDRFFQMDLLRRAAAGELADLLGPSVLRVDRERRIHRFRTRAAAALARLDAGERALLKRYTEGVNAGLDSLTVRPVEYLLLRQRPQPWTEIDSLLTVYAMYFDLQIKQVERELVRGYLKTRMPDEVFRFLSPDLGPIDAPLDLPPETQIAAPVPPATTPPWQKTAPGGVPTLPVANAADPTAETHPGSNGWAVAGALTTHGGAILASDMHLTLRMPNTWYRMALVFPDPTAPHGLRLLAGVTLPGMPNLVVGSNQQIAWGFTNSYGDWIDLIEVERDPVNPLRYNTSEGWVEGVTRRETIFVRGVPAETVDVFETRWGPVFTAGGKSYAVRWVAHDPEAVNLKLNGLERAPDVPAALAVGQSSGIPAQNMLVADGYGRVGWTQAGPLPKRAEPGDRNTYPRPGTDPQAGWTAYYTPLEYPKVMDPTLGRVWNGNNQALAGPDALKIGDGGPASGARGKRIRDLLLSQSKVDEEVMHEIQLDERNETLGGAAQFILSTLDASAIQGNAARAEYRAAVEHWLTKDGQRASAGSTGFLLTHSFAKAMFQKLYGPLHVETQRLAPGSRLISALPRIGVATDQLLRLQPKHWLPAGATDWRTMALQVIDEEISLHSRRGKSLVNASWGDQNRAAIQHPLSGALPGVSYLLDAPRQPLPGDKDTVRVQTPNFGASERLVVSPGREHLGILETPGGQSGHPLSPYYLSHHRDWVEGNPAPLLPGPPRHRMLLFPARR